MSTFRNGFTYTTLLRGGDIRRMPGIQIRDVLNSSPNGCQFTVDGQSYAPRAGEKIEILDGVVVKFSGVVQTVVQVYEGQTNQLAWQVNCVDWLAYANRRLPFASYENVSASDVVKDLIARFAVGFTSTHVQTLLANVTMTFDGSMNLGSCLDAVAAELGGGHWYFDIKDLHFFHVKPPDFNIPTTPPAVMTLGPGTAMTATESAVVGGLVAGSFPPGWYVFRSSFVYNNGAESMESPISNPVFLQGITLPQLAGIPIGPAIGALSCVRRNIFYQSFTRASGTTPWKQWGSVADNVTTTTTPAFTPTDTAQPTPYVAPPVGSVAAPTASENTSAPATSVTTTSTTTTTTSDNSAFIRDGYIGPGYGAYAGYTTHIRDGRTNALWITPPGIVAPGILHPPQGLYGIWYGPLGEQGPAGSGGWLPESYFTQAVSPTSTSTPVQTPVVHPNLTAGYYAFKITNVYRDGTESLPTPQSNSVSLTGIWAVHLDNCALGAASGAIDVVFRKVYYSVYIPTPQPGTPNFLQGHTGLATILPNNSQGSIDFTYFLGDALPPSSPTSRIPTWPHVDGPDLEGTDLPDPLDANNTTLIRDPQLTSESDGSQVRNRIYVTGQRTSVIRDAFVGSSIVDVADLGAFFVTGGKALMGAVVVDYEAVSGLTGAGAIFLRSPLSAAVKSGTSISNYIMVEDKEGQRLLGQIELDDNGNPTDGIHEAAINDASLTTVEQAYTRGFAELELFSRPITTVNYGTRDPKTRAGKIIHIDLRNPPVYGDFLIQEVTIDQYLDEAESLTVLQPRYTVRASSVRFDLTDLLRKIATSIDSASQAGLGQGSAAVGAAIVPPTPVSSVDDIPLISDRSVFWTMLDASNFGGAALPTLVSNGWANSSTAGGSGVKDSDGYWYRHANTAAGEGNEIHQFIPNSVNYQANQTFRQRWTVRLTSVTNFIMFFVLSDTNGLIYDGPVNGGVAANNARKGFGVRVDDSGFTGWFSNGTTAAITSVFAPVALNGIYTIEVAQLGGVVTVKVNGVSTTFATPAITSQTLLGVMQLYTKTGAKSFDWKAVYGERV